ncbi:hypothetical protein ACJMK2_032541 [Sinanodonta woodiana]|uniref:Uncharacterized protein n=1 Tax=Sinanodonta woodiana TaxID=1069815 RepID=A0ABD3X485_SINWO
MSQILRDEFPSPAEVMVANNVKDPDYTDRLYSINPMGYKGYMIRPKGKQPILPDGEMVISKEVITVEQPTPLLWKIKKRTGGECI